MDRAGMLAYVKANHGISEEGRAPGGGVQYVLDLGIKTGTGEQWFITYGVTGAAGALQAAVTHFGPFGSRTAAGLS